MESYRRQSKQPKGLTRGCSQTKMRHLGSTGHGTKGLHKRSCAELALQCEVSHYEVLVRASRWYQGYDFSKVDGDFKTYLLSGCGNVPHYVRQYLHQWQPGLLLA